MLKLPGLSSSQANYLDSFCKKVQKDINSFIFQELTKEQTDTDQPNKIVHSYINGKYYWIDDENSELPY